MEPLREKCLKNSMQNIITFINKNRWFILAVVIILGAFYWYEWRPTMIEKECSSVAFRMMKDTGSVADSDTLYNLCVSNGGLDNIQDALKQ